MRHSVTVVVSTYNRPDVLPVALRSAIAQGEAVAEVLVVGDHCDARTEAACGEVDDERIRYVNLPTRFGEQSGPNSVGMLLAQTEFVAFLNQDDLMLPGHIGLALARLQASGADLFLGRAAFATTVAVDTRGRTVPVFEHIHPPVRRASGFRNLRSCEPASAWVLRRELAERVGPWRPARQLQRAPIVDWALRAWRLDVPISFGERVSVLKIGTQYRREADGPAYDLPSPEHAGIEAWLAQVGVDALREAITRQVGAQHRPLRSVLVRLRRRLRHDGPTGLLIAGLRNLARRVVDGRPSAELFYRTGFDAWSAAMWAAGRVPGRHLDMGSRRRTGSPLPDPVSLEEVLQSLPQPKADARSAG